MRARSNWRTTRGDTDRPSPAPAHRRPLPAVDPSTPHPSSLITRAQHTEVVQLEPAGRACSEGRHRAGARNRPLESRAPG